MKCKRCPGPCLEGCLLGKASYCSYCAKYGHFTVYCSNHNKNRTDPQTTNRTAINEWPTAPRQITICKSEKAIRAFLYFYKLSVCQKMETNIKNINRFCRENGWAKTVFIEPAENIDSEENEEVYS